MERIIMFISSKNREILIIQNLLQIVSNQFYTILVCCAVPGMLSFGVEIVWGILIQNRGLSEHLFCSSDSSNSFDYWINF